MKKEYHYGPELDIAAAKKTAELMKKAADEYIFDPNTEVMPAPRHWGEFPGRTRVCFTKTMREDGSLYYHMSVSAPYGKVKDLVVAALLKLFEAPSTVTEVPPGINPNVRHFFWPADQSTKIH